MARTVPEVMTENPVTLQAETPLVEAARKMRDDDIGDVLVLKDGKLCGVGTDRDITIRATAEGQDPIAVRLGDVCSEDLDTNVVDSPLSEPVHLMRTPTLRW